MKIKTKPVKPVRKVGEIREIGRSHDLSFFEGSIEGVISELTAIQKTAGFYDIAIEIDHDYGFDNDEYHTVHIRGKYDETDEEYAHRLTVYNTKLSEYNAWYVANKTAIEESIAKHKAREKAAKDSEIARLEKAIAKLKKS